MSRPEEQAPADIVPTSISVQENILTRAYAVLWRL